MYRRIFVHLCVVLVQITPATLTVSIEDDAH